MERLQALYAVAIVLRINTLAAKADKSPAYPTMRRGYFRALHRANTLADCIDGGHQWRNWFCQQVAH